MTAAMEKFWKITGYDGTAKIFERVLPLDSLSEKETLLQRLAAARLRPDEIINASLRRNAKSFAPLLEPQQESKPSSVRLSITVGLSPNYVDTFDDQSRLWICHGSPRPLEVCHRA
jgi:hypothetical protein